MKLGANSSKGDTPTVIMKLCFHNDILFSSPLGPVFNVLVNFSPEKKKPAGLEISTRPGECQNVLDEYKL